MAFLPELLEKIKSFPAAAADFLKRQVEHSLEKIPAEKRGAVIIGFSGGIAALTLLIVGIALIAGAKPGGQTGALPEALPASQIIPPEELFLPDEPDFIPGVLPGRERRPVWTAEDAAPWWQDPLKNGEEPWRNRLEAAIDEFMETVP